MWCEIEIMFFFIFTRNVALHEEKCLSFYAIKVFELYFGFSRNMYITYFAHNTKIRYWKISHVVTFSMYLWKEKRTCCNFLILCFCNGFSFLIKYCNCEHLVINEKIRNVTSLYYLYSNEKKRRRKRYLKIHHDTPSLVQNLRFRCLVSFVK